MTQAIYGGGGSYYGLIVYGQNPQLSFNAQPMWARPYLNYGQVRVFWTTPVPKDGSSYIGIRLIRNFDQYPEHSEDGKIIIENYGTNPTLGGTTYYDDTVIPGQFVYYRIFVLLGPTVQGAAFEWFDAGTAFCLAPAAHDSKTPVNTFKSVSSSNVIGDVRIPQATLMTTHDKFMSLLPSIYQYGNDQGIVKDVPTPTQNNDNPLSVFLNGFSLTLDDLMTYADTTKPDSSGRRLNPSVVNVKSYQLGLPMDQDGNTTQQKKLIRNAFYTYSRKGTRIGLERFVEDITGNDSTITVGPNLMLSIQDASFYKGIGFWKVVGTGATITPDFFAPMAIGTGESVFDTEYTGKVVVSSTNTTITNGFGAPLTKGIPVSPSTAYDMVFNYYAPSNFTWSIAWYDVSGTALTPTTGSVTVTPSTWTKASVSFTTPLTAVKGLLSFTFATVGTYYLDRIGIFPDVASPAYTEPRMVTVFLNPTKTNLITNPSVEVDTTGWSITGTGTSIARVAETTTDILGPSYTPNGSYLLKSTFATGACTLSPNTTTATANNYYTFSIYSATKTGSQPFVLNLKASMPVTMISSQVVGTTGTVWFQQGHPFRVGDSISFTGGSLNGTSSTVTAINDASVSFVTAVGAYTKTNDASTATISTASSKSSIATIDTAITQANYVSSISATYTYSATSQLAAIGQTISILGVAGGTYNQFVKVTAVATITAGTTYSFTASGVGFSNTPGSGGLAGFAWARNSVTLYVPATWKSTSSTYGAITVAPTITTTTANGVIYFDSSQLEAAVSATDYFDGSMVGQGGKWAGTAFNSVSYYYPNRTKRRLRLRLATYVTGSTSSDIIKGYLPANTPYIISDYIDTGVMKLS